MNEWREYIPFDVLTLLVAVATLIVSILAYRYNRRCNKQNKINLIASKEAQLKAMEQSTQYGGVSSSEIGTIRMNIAALQAEIDQLKKTL